MTPARLVLVVAAVLLFADWQYGSGRLVQSFSDQCVEIAYRLNSAFSHIVRRMASP
jgi:hypothetical protein